MKSIILSIAFSLTTSTAFSQITSYDLFEKDTIFVAKVENAKILSGINKSTGNWLTDTTVSSPGRIEITQTQIKITGPINRIFKVLKTIPTPTGIMFLVYEESSNKFYHIDYAFQEDWQADQVLIIISGTLEEFISLEGRRN